MSYVEEIYNRVVEKNPAEPEFHQAVKEVLDSLSIVIEQHEEEYRKAALLERLTEVLPGYPYGSEAGRGLGNIC